jgi:hypothetical protein
VRLVASIARRVREQAASEDRARLIAQFNSPGDAQPATVSGLMRRPVHPESWQGRDDPLEHLWSLPAKHPRGPR